MAIQGSGKISLGDLASEFVDTAPNSLSEFYLNGGLVTANNTGVPSSGVISLSEFYGTYREIQASISGVSSSDLQTIFGSDWGTNVPKRLTVTGTNGPMTIPSGMGGSLIVENNGEIQGLGGARGVSGPGGNGGHAITAHSSFTLINNGAVRGGGGGGGHGGSGGTGGQGYYTSRIWNGQQYNWNNYRWANNWCSNTTRIWWAGSLVYSAARTTATQVYTGGYYYNRGTYVRTTYPGQSCGATHYYVDRGYDQTYYTSGGAGGAGGNGGYGRGYGQNWTNGNAGSAGSPGGTNAGTGGTGGTGGGGGGWAVAGGTGWTGNSGANGNYTNGQSGYGGYSGGAAGRAVYMASGTVSVTNNGTINGAY